MTDYFASDIVNTPGHPSSGGSTPGESVELLTTVSGATLQSKMAAGELTPFTSYKISDFRTVHKVVGSTHIHTGDVEQLIVTAISTREVDIRAYSPAFPLDYIEIDMHDTLCEDNTTARLGRITKRRDENGNEAPWDFRQVKHLVQTLIAPEWTAQAYAYGRLVTHSGWIYKAAWIGGEGAEAGDVPGTSYKWIKYLPVGSLLLPKKLTATQSDNLGYALQTGVTYGSEQYFYTFTNSLNEQRSADFDHMVIGSGSQNVVCFAADGKLLSGLNIGRNSDALRFAGDMLNSDIGRATNCVHYLACTNNNYGWIENSIFGSSNQTNVEMMFKCNIMHAVANGVTFPSETVYNNIDSIANSTVGSDFWDNRVGSIQYCQIGNRFTSNFVQAMEKLTTMGICYTCQFPGTDSDITLVSSCANTIFASGSSSLIWEALTEYGVILTDFTQLADLTVLKRIVGDDVNGFYTIKTGLAGEELREKLADHYYPPYEQKELAVILSQLGTAYPTSVVLRDTWGGFYIYREDVGKYVLEPKVLGLLSYDLVIPAEFQNITVERQNIKVAKRGTQIYIETRNDEGDYSDEILDNTLLKFFVYMDEQALTADYSDLFETATAYNVGVGQGAAIQIKLKTRKDIDADSISGDLLYDFEITLSDDQNTYNPSQISVANGNELIIDSTPLLTHGTTVTLKYYKTVAFLFDDGLPFPIITDLHPTNII